jgi:hypothetical protein
MKALLLALPVAVALLFGPAQAEEKLIKMKLITKSLNEAGGGAHVFGSTFQQDGTVGTKDFFIKESGNKGELVGLSTYTFADGSITASFRGEEVGKGQHRGTYVILTGTGAYTGATGTGGFEGTGAQDSPIKGVGLYDITLNVNVPARSN